MCENVDDGNIKLDASNKEWALLWIKQIAESYDDHQVEGIPVENPNKLSLVLDLETECQVCKETIAELLTMSKIDSDIDGTIIINPQVEFGRELIIRRTINAHGYGDTFHVSHVRMNK